MAHGVLSPGCNLEASQSHRSHPGAVLQHEKGLCLKAGMWNKEMLEGWEKGFVATFQESLRSLSHSLGELQCLSNPVGELRTVPSQQWTAEPRSCSAQTASLQRTSSSLQMVNKLQYRAGLAPGLLSQQRLGSTRGEHLQNADRKPRQQPSSYLLDMLTM